MKAQQDFMFTNDKEVPIFLEDLFCVLKPETLIEVFDLDTGEELVDPPGYLEVYEVTIGSTSEIKNDKSELQFILRVGVNKNDI
jgi:hypothetical protein